MKIVLGLGQGRNIENKVEDAVQYILNADNRTFNKIMRTLRNPNGELDIRYKEEIEDPSRTQLVIKIADVIRAFRELDVKEYDQSQSDRIEDLRKCRGEEDLKKLIERKYKVSKSEASDLMAVLTGEKAFKEFIEEKSKPAPAKRSFLSLFRRNKVKALPEGEASQLTKYSHMIEQIVNHDISFSFPIERLDSANYAKVQTILFDERETKQHSIVMGKDAEADWKINPELKEYVYHDMPLQLTPEEQAVWVYMKLCKTFAYDDKQIFDTKDNSLNKSFLEGVKPGDKIICFDFSRIYAKFINETLGDSLEAKVIGGQGHFLVELMGQDSFVIAEATTAQGHSNEFYKMRMGLPIEGLKAVYDPNNKFSKAISDLTPLVYDDVQSINSYMKMLDTIREQEDMTRDDTKENDVLGKLSALAKTMKEHEVTGTEAMMGVMTFGAVGFFGENAQRTWIKQNIQDEVRGPEGRSAIVVNKSGEEFYILNGDTMEVEVLPREEIIERFNSGKYEYRGSTHTIAAIEGEVPVPEDDEKEGEKDDNVK